VCALAEGKSAEITTLTQAMTPNPIAINPDCRAIDALREMNDRGLRHFRSSKTEGSWSSRAAISRGRRIDRLDEERSCENAFADRQGRGLIKRCHSPMEATAWSPGDALNVLIVYGTTEGQTRKIAEWTATHIRERGHQAELRDSAALLRFGS